MSNEPLATTDYIRLHNLRHRQELQWLGVRGLKTRFELSNKNNFKVNVILNNIRILQDTSRYCAILDKRLQWTQNVTR